MNLFVLIENFLRPLAPLPRRVYNLGGSSAALFLAMRDGPFMAVEATEEASAQLFQDVVFFRELLHRDSGGVCFLPPGDGPEVSGQRARAVFRLAVEGSASSLVTSSNALNEMVWEPGRLREAMLRLAAGYETGRDALEQRLIQLGYSRVPLVTERGQYSLRGYIMDVFPSTSGGPFRVEFMGDEIEGLRAFDVETQRSVGEVARVELLPAREPSGGIMPGRLLPQADIFYSESVQWEPPDGAVALSRFRIEGGGVDAGHLQIAGLGVLPGERKDIYGLPDALGKLMSSYRVLLVGSSGGQAERLREVLTEKGLICPLVELQRAADYSGNLYMTVGNLSAGLNLPGLLVLTEREMFGERPAYRPMRKSRASGLLTNVDDLRAGDYVVHADRGVGRFEGLVHQSIEGYGYDLLSLLYEGGDRLYIPLHAIDRVRKYHAGEGAAPRLDSLGTRKWQRTRERVKKKIKEMAVELLRVYAEREVADGFAFSPDTEMHREFDGFFPYEETPDQAAAVEDIKRDMESGRPMERLLCGDVGYGKTEVAMRAAFKALYDGKQVAVLVPTTLLCEQHLRIFRSRFAAFPVTVEALSRFRSSGERAGIIKRLKQGGVDVIIATHALLKPSVEFSDLGLLVIDEEHRFGVRQKERIKKLKRGVDVLSMSATPIPRTMQMSLTGIRKMSVIETPPEERVAVKSLVAAFDEGLIRDAVDREVERGGQVFFVHNRVKDIGRMEKKLGRILPLARVAVAHGQMRERELEDVMMAFLEREVDVLLSTAIIGSGLDIPTANTIIVNMADRMGLADLYQLRGRVGRSNVRAYAYFLVPAGESVTEEARQRLQAVQELSYMGAGFRLALKDLEIRGAGNFLGPEQSGCIDAVGFDLYMEMLERAVSELKGVEIKERIRPVINIRVNAFIPGSYIEDMALRLSAYRSVYSARSREDLAAIESEMSDRFGRPPLPFMNLLGVRRLSLQAEELSISEISAVAEGARFVLSGDTTLTAEDILGAFDGKARFVESGFELSLKSGSFEEIEEALAALREAAGALRQE